MTKLEFRSSVPDVIEHRSSGYGVLEIIADTEEKKGICYRHRDRTSSFGTWGKNWFEVHEKLMKSLAFHGYIQE